jgi:type III secretion protein N (ATPase)
VLIEDEEGGDPIGEEVRSILDGHVYLSRKLAQANHYPAIDPLTSLSRVFPRVTSLEHQAAAGKVRAWLAKYAEIEFLLQIGEYKPGGDPLADEAVQRMPALRALLQQGAHEGVAAEAALAQLAEAAS